MKEWGLRKIMNINLNFLCYTCSVFAVRCVSYVRKIGSIVNNFWYGVWSWKKKRFVAINEQIHNWLEFYLSDVNQFWIGADLIKMEKWQPLLLIIPLTKKYMVFRFEVRTHHQATLDRVTWVTFIYDSLHEPLKCHSNYMQPFFMKIGKPLI